MSRRPRSGFGQRLEIAIAHAGITKADLADRMGKSRQQVSNWLKRTDAPSDEMVHGIANVLRVSPSWLHYGDAGEERPEEVVNRRPGGAPGVAVGGTDELWAELPDTSYLLPRAQAIYDAQLGSYMRRGWPRDVIVEAAQSLVRHLGRANALFMEGDGRELTEDDQVLVIEAQAETVESLATAWIRARR